MLYSKHGPAKALQTKSQSLLGHQTLFVQGDAAGSQAVTAVQQLASRRRQQRSRQPESSNGITFRGLPQERTGLLPSL